MSGISADRQKLIDAKVQAAVKAKTDRSEQLKQSSSVTPGDFSVSIFIDNMTAEEKNYAYAKYAESILAKYDANNDKNITVAEFTQKEVADMGNDWVQSNPLAAQRSGNLFAENLDTNGDGTISIDEFSYFLKEADTMDDPNNMAQDGVITEKSEADLADSVGGTNISDEKLKEVTKKYLEGQTLTAEEQKILNNGSKTIRTSMASRAKEYFGMELGDAADKNVYVANTGASSAVTAEFTDISRQAQSFVYSFMGGSFWGTGVPSERTTVNIEGPEKKNNNTISFLGNTGAGANSGIYANVDLGMGFGNILGYGNTLGMGRTTIAANTGASKWWNIGNIVGQSFSILGFLNGMFGGWGCGDNHGGLGWWFHRLG